MKWGIERSKLLTRMSELPACGNLIHEQYDNFLRMKFEVDWRWARNPASRRSFHKNLPKLSALQQRLVEDSTPRAWQYVTSTNYFKTVVCGIASARKYPSSVQAMRSSPPSEGNNKDFNEKKHYILTKYPQDRKPLITASNPLLGFGVNPLILDVVNSYLGMWSKLIYFDMWYTLPLNTETRFLSQRWHRDPEDRKKIRTFLYFSNVDIDAGAMEYFMGSHVGGPYEHVFRWEGPLGIPYPPDGEIERQIPASQRMILKGPPGTLIFCDTAGFHRGGICRTIPRILATSAFVTPASLHRRRYEIDETVRNAPWPAPARFAVI